MLLGELLHGMKDSMYRKTTDWTGKTKDGEIYTVGKTKSGYAWAVFKNGTEMPNYNFPKKEDADKVAQALTDGKNPDAPFQDSTHDSPNYYDMIVELSRSDNNIKGNRGLAQRQSQRAIEANGQKFDSNEFNKAFNEFRGANVSKGAFYKGPKDSKTMPGSALPDEEKNTKDEIHNCTRCENQLTYEKEDDKNTYMKCGLCGKEYVFPKKDESKDASVKEVNSGHNNVPSDYGDKMVEKIKAAISNKNKALAKSLLDELSDYTGGSLDGMYHIPELSKSVSMMDTRGNVNHMGERQFDTYEGWKKACRQINPSVKIEGDKEVAQAGDVGEWDGAHGIIYGD